MDRREFFKRGLGRAAEKAVKIVDDKVAQRAVRWIRPPFAIPELEFLLACTRCDACIKACPYDVIFPLSPSNGAEVMNSPALDLLNKGCHLCDDWPCVNACETGALKMVVPEPDNEQELAVVSQLPKLAKVRIDEDTCLPYLGPECGACASACSVEGALLWQMERPTINEEICTGCAMCREACITSPNSVNIIHKVSMNLE